MSESATIQMAQKARELNARGISVINLSLGEPDFDTPLHIREAAKRALDEGHTKYTPVPGELVLRQAIVDKLKRDNGLNYTTDQIVVSCGAKQSIANVVLSIIDPGDEVILFSPYWVSYFEIVRLAEGIPVLVKATVDTEFKVSPHDLRKAITSNTKAIIFSSPCNPTGSVWSKSELEEIANVLQDFPRIIVISDEIYEYINYTDSHVSIAGIEGMFDRTVTINGFSKGFAMTGWRLGYAAAPLSIAKACGKIQGQFTSGANAFSQIAAAHALNSDMGPTQVMKAAFESRRNLMLHLIDEIPGFKCHIPQGAFYIFPDVSEIFGKSYKDSKIDNAADLAIYLLEEAHVATVDGAAFGAPECIRLSYAASEEDLKAAMKRIYAAISKLS